MKEALKSYELVNSLKKITHKPVEDLDNLQKDQREEDQREEDQGEKKQVRHNKADE